VGRAQAARPTPTAGGPRPGDVPAAARAEAPRRSPPS
jgi:hypothetical protein